MQDYPSQDPIFFNPDYHDLIGLIYDAVTSRDGFFPFLKRFVEVFEGHSGTFAIFDTRSNSLLGYWIVNIPDDALEFYAEHVSHQDALVELAVSVHESEGPRFVASNLDMPNVDRIKRETRAGEWLQSYGAQDAAGAVAFQSDNYLNFFGIQRSADQRSFSRKDLMTFDIFLPHISRAVELYTKISAFDLANAPERAALNQVQQGILICDATFKIIFVNVTAEEIVATNRSLEISEDGLLSFRGKDFTRQFIVALSSAVRDSMEAGGSIADAVLHYRSGNQHLTVIVSPLTATDSEARETRRRGGAMISLYDWAHRPAIKPEMLQKFFDLSPAESRVSALLLSGYSPADIADQLNRSRETIKSHLQSIYRKTNTSRQGELVALLAASSGLG